MSEPALTYEVDDRVAHIRFCRPDRMNALDDGVFAELFDLTRRANDDTDVRVIVFGATGPNFCAGGDLNWESEFGSHDASRVLRNAAYVGAELRRSPKVVLGAVRGYCIGGGIELLLHLDATIASETAQFAMPETRWGILPFWDTPQLLPLAIGDRAAREMLLFGRMYSADQALDMGLVNSVVRDDHLEATVASWARELLPRDPEALHMVKVALNAPAAQLAAAHEHEAAMVGIRASNHQYRSTVKSFFDSPGERRPLAAPPRRQP